jgi:hypothetical protein
MTLETLNRALKDMDEKRLPSYVSFEEFGMLTSIHAEIERQRANGVEPVIEDQGNGKFGFTIDTNTKAPEQTEPEISR